VLGVLHITSELCNQIKESAMLVHYFQIYDNISELLFQIISTIYFVFPFD